MIILWQFEKIRGFTTLTKLNPCSDPNFDSKKSEVLPPIVTFDFPKSVAQNNTIQLNLHVKNQGDSEIQIEVQLKKNLDFMWVGKTKLLYTIQPDVSPYHNLILFRLSRD